MTRILVVEDEVKLAEVIRDYLKASCYETDLLHRGDQVLPWLKQQSADLIILDLMLPGKDGLTLCREIRAGSDVPIIITTAKVEEIDRLLGLELGADDYLCKPYSPRELVARVKTILRRVAPAFEQSSTALHLIPDTTTVVFGDRQVELSVVEFNLLKNLLRKPGQIFSRDKLIDQIYQDHRLVNDRTVDSHIKKLRKKLALLSDSQDFIQSVYGAGYRYMPPAIDPL